MRLAIKGHTTRGAEVITLLEMLGGKNTHNYSADSEGLCFYLGKGTNTIYYDWANSCYEDEDMLVFSLEEFLEKFPYKVGDKVQRKGATSCDTVYEIEQINWEYDQVVYIICDLYWKNLKCTVTTENLQPYKEETMEGVYADNEINCYHKDFGDKVRIRLGGDYEIKVEDKITYIVKKQPHYPKTYEECCEVLMGKTNFQDFGLVLAKFSTTMHEEDSISPAPPHITLINNFYKLFLCRDAYWRMAGDWKYDVNKIEDYFLIVNKCGRIVKEHYMSFNHILAFPTAEMRDAFLENFKELIEICKELL